jgi:hypothetical protein
MTQQHEFCPFPISILVCKQLKIMQIKSKKQRLPVADQPHFAAAFSTVLMQ